MINARCFENGGAVVACGGGVRVGEFGGVEAQSMSHNDTDIDADAELIYPMHFGILYCSLPSLPLPGS